MIALERVVGIVLRMPDVVGSCFQVGGRLLDRVLVVPIETGFVDDIYDGFLTVADGQCGIGGTDVSVGLDLQNGAEVDALLWVASGVAGHE